MKFARYMYGGGERWGIPEGSALSEIKGDPLNGYEMTGVVHILGERHDTHIEYLPPCLPGQMIIVGWNYKNHARGSDDKQIGPAEPMYYPLSPRSIVGHEAKVIYPFGVERVEHEAELVVIMGKRAKGVRASDAKRYILGYSCGNDVSARDIQNHPVNANLPRAKTIDTFSPVGPYLVTDIDADDLPIRAAINGQIRQDARTSDMFFGVGALIEAISTYITLEPWDVIFTGTPVGSSVVQRGDMMEVTIEGIGTLLNQVV